MLELGTVCVHDHKIDNPNMQDFPPLKNDICTKHMARKLPEFMHK